MPRPVSPRLTQKQKALLDVIAAFRLLNGYSPTYQDMGNILGCSGVNCFKMLKTIKKNGFLPGTEEKTQDNSCKVYEPLTKVA